MNLRPQDASLWRVIFWCCLAAAFLLLVGCVTISDCSARIYRGVVMECRWQ